MKRIANILKRKWPELNVRVCSPGSAGNKTISKPGEKWKQDSLEKT
jgi:hypothetical protein